MSHKFTFLLFVLYLFFVHCFFVEKEKLPNNSLKTSYSLKKFPFSITCSDSIYYKEFSYRNYTDSTILILYNYNLSSIDIFNTRDSQLLKRINYKDFVNKENNVEGLYYHNKDSIFVFQSQVLSIININGDRILLDSINQQEESQMTLSNIGDATPIYYDSNNHTLNIPQYCSGCTFHESKYYKEPIQVGFNILTKQYKEYPITYPKLYWDAYYGFAKHSHRVVRDSNDIFTFSSDPNIYIFNRYSNEIKVKNARSKYHTTEIECLDLKYKNDSNKKLKHLALSAAYLRLFWDPYKKLYYRFFSKNQAEKNSDGSYNSYRDKSVCLMVLDSDFNIIDEIELERYKYLYHKSFVSEKGFHISINPTINPQKGLNYEVFNFSINN
jgi:hypothetical protein